jgi:outer membrane receptor for ferrienterochelin and colicin
MGSDIGHANLSVAAAQKVGDMKLSVAGLFGRGTRSNVPFTDFDHTTFQEQNLQLDPAFINVGIKWKELSARFIYDHYRVDEQDGLAINETHEVKQQWIGYYAEVKYDHKANNELTITPKINYTHQLPWNITDATALEFYDKTADRLTGGASASWDPRKGISLLVGAEVYYDHAQLNEPALDGTPQTQFNLNSSMPTNDISYVNEALYAQGLWNHPLANLTVGARYEHHSGFGNSFVPRIALTKLIAPFHIKLLYSEAFRSPGIEDINLAPSASQPVQPEHTRVVEAEGGYAIDAHNFVTLNAFYINMSQPIVYFVNADNSEGYENFDHVSTAGVEADYKVRYKWGYFDANYSYYRTLANRVPLYAVADHPDALLGMPTHKVTLHGAYNVWKQLRIAPTLIMQSGAWGFMQPSDGMGMGTLQQAHSEVIANVFASYRDLGIKGVEAGIGGYNLLDTKILYMQPYDGGHAPLRGATRELLLRIGYTRPW